MVDTNTQNRRRSRSFSNLFGLLSDKVEKRAEPLKEFKQWLISTGQGSDFSDYMLEKFYLYDKVDEKYTVNSGKLSKQSKYVDLYKKFIFSKVTGKNREIDFYYLIPAISNFNRGLLQGILDSGVKVRYPDNIDTAGVKSLVQVFQQKIGLFLSESKKRHLPESEVAEHTGLAIKCLIRLEGAEKEGLNGETLIETVSGLGDTFPIDVFEYLARESSHTGQDLSKSFVTLSEKKENDEKLKKLFKYLDSTSKKTIFKMFEEIMKGQLFTKKSKDYKDVKRVYEILKLEQKVKTHSSKIESGRSRVSGKSSVASRPSIL